MTKYSEHYWKLEKYKQNFEKLIERIKSTDNFEEKLDLAVYAAEYFVSHNTGYYTSSVLEKVFVDCAKKIKTDLSNIHYKKDSVLHVITMGYETGGHTRVVERWIENAPSNQVHSVLQTTAANIKLAVLEKNIKSKNGEFIVLENSLSLKEKAAKLREYAMNYEYIILHTHMEDPVPIIAFGTEEFTRPVFLYNHASHHPWIGKSIADLVLDIENNDSVTTEKRGITNTYFLGVPSKEISVSIPDKNKFKEKINFPSDKKIIVTCGTDIKYRTISGRSFADYLSSIMDENTRCYVIGIPPENREWRNAINRSGKDIILMGPISFENGFLDYLKAADLYLDSYPLCGGTATIDAISSGTPALSLKSVYPQFDYLTRTSAYCKTEKEFIDKAKRVLNDQNYANELFQELKNSLIEHQSIEVWNKKIEKLFETAPKFHKVKDLSNSVDYSESNDLSVLCNTLIDRNFLTLKDIKLLSDKDITEIIKYGNLYKKQGIPFIFNILSYKKYCKKIKIIKLFGMTIYKYSKFV